MLQCYSTYPSRSTFCILSLPLAPPGNPPGTSLPVARVCPLSPAQSSAKRENQQMPLNSPSPSGHIRATSRPHQGHSTPKYSNRASGNSPEPRPFFPFPETLQTPHSPHFRRCLFVCLDRISPHLGRFFFVIVPFLPSFLPFYPVCIHSNIHRTYPTPRRLLCPL